MGDAPCIFCRIIAGDIPAEAIYEDEYVLAVLDAFPIAPGHTIVLPRVHAPTILELPDAALAPVFAGVREVTNRLRIGLVPHGFTIGINHGRHAGQAIDHLHIHVVPRWEHDRGGSIHSVVQNPPVEDLKTIAEKVRKSTYGNRS